MTTARLNVLTISTPEGVSFSLPLAGFASRFLAYLIDLGILVGVTIVLSIALSLLFAFFQDLGMMLQFLAMFILWTGYGIALEWYWRGRTIGKRALGLRVVDESGMNLRLSQVVVRNLLRLADMPFLPIPINEYVAIPVPLCLVGGLVAAFSKRSQRLGDLAGRTIVVRMPRVEEPDLRGVLSDKFNSFRDYPHIEARLRQRTSPALAALAVAALLRRETLDAPARVELFAGIAETFRDLIDFPQEATDGLSDEQYVRNAVETLYRRKG